MYLMVIILFVGGFLLGQATIEKSHLKTMTKVPSKSISARSTSGSDIDTQNDANNGTISDEHNDAVSDTTKDKRFIFFQQIANLDIQAIAFGLCLEDINPFPSAKCPDQDSLMEILADNKAKQDELIQKITWNDIPVAEKKECEKTCRCSLVLRIIEANAINVTKKILKTLERKSESITNDHKLQCVRLLLK